MGPHAGDVGGLGNSSLESVTPNQDVREETVFFNPLRVGLKLKLTKTISRRKAFRFIYKGFM